jgi:hypothetical protein
MIRESLDEFSLTWIRADRKANLSSDYPEADAFQKICGSILDDTVYKESAGLNFNLISFPLLGKDGGIDHYSFLGKDGNAIVECKKNKSVKNCFSEINELRNKLFKNLSKENAVNSIYSPWFNKDLKYYIFCTSCKVSNASEYEKIVYEVNRAIKSLEIISGLSHLKFVEIKVYCWPHLQAWLEKSPFLMFQWVEPGVEGIEYFSAENFPREGFQSYLSSIKIPYSSRDDFMRSHPEVDDLPSERKYMDALIESDGNIRGIIIHGQGGIGKTRLMCELALMAIPKGWVSYLVRTLDAFKHLNTVLRPGGKYIIMIDYVEEFDRFHDVIKRYLQEKRLFEFKFIVNCRSSYFNFNEVYLAAEFIPMDISDSKQSTRHYYIDLINKIIENIPALKDLNNGIFEQRPSFAVFVRYLYETNKQHYYKPNKDLKFQRWLTSRLELSFSDSKDKKYDKELVAKIFCCLPAYGRGLNFLEKNFTKEINILISDGWLEKRNIDGNQYQLTTIHDSIADELLIENLKQYSHTLNSVIQNYFSFAAKNNLINGCLRAFERISNDPIVSDFNFIAILIELIGNYPEELQWAYFDLAQTSLISHESRVYFLYNRYFHRFRAELEFGRSLSFLLTGLIGKEMNGGVRQKVDELYDKWFRLNRNEIFSWEFCANIMFASIRFFGRCTKVQQMLEDYLKKSKLQENTFWVYSIWLSVKGERSVIVSSFEKWLALHGSIREAYIAIGAWLENGGERSVVASSFEKWLVLHGEIKEADMVIGSWLKAGGEKSVVALSVQKWMALHGEIKEA